MTPEELGAQITQDSKTLAEQFYFFTVVIMWLIHAGFMAYEAGVARRKNVMSTALKNILTIAVVTPSFYYLGWWIYGCMERGFVPTDPGRRVHDRRVVRPVGVLQVDARLRRQHGPEPAGQHLRRLLGRVPAVLLDDGLDHVRRADRARAARRLPAAGQRPRLRGVDPRRRLGLERRRLARHGVGLPRRDRLGRGPRRRGRLHARGAAAARPTHRQVLERPGRRAASCRTTCTSRCSA